MGVRVLADAAGRAFLLGRDGRATVGCDPTTQIERVVSWPRWARVAAALCRPRPTLRPGCGRAPRRGGGPSRIAGFGPNNSKEGAQFSFFLFQ